MYMLHFVPSGTDGQRMAKVLSLRVPQRKRNTQTAVLCFTTSSSSSFRGCTDATPLTSWGRP